MANKLVQKTNLKPKYLFGFENTKRPSSPSGTGFLDIVKTEKDPKTGIYFSRFVGKHNLQEQMDEEAKGVNLKDMLAMCDEGKIKKANTIFGNVVETDLYSNRKNALAVSKLWDTNPLIRAMYPTKDDFKKDIVAGVDIEKNAKEFGARVIQASKDAFKKFNEPVKEKEQPIEQPKKEQSQKSEEK